ncbi:BatD family protein [Algihabitans albus]|uniref:BatD family protein n=1 Tax=Algihabitans albus TaxID=2164067 RepID=UPI000E5CF3FF|nr:BatD family protein [Algihabitans albus]
MRYLLLLLLCLAFPMTAAAEQPILRTELKTSAAIPGQPIELRVTILVPTWMPQPPRFPSFETPSVIVRLPIGGARPISERVDGETWSGVTRRYRLYPMTAGSFRIPPQTATVAFVDPQTRQPRTVELLSSPLVFEGRVPQGAETLVPFIAADSLTLEQTLGGTAESLEVGGAVTRRLIARTEGVSPIFLPPLIPPLSAEGLSAYPKEPVVTESETESGVSGSRAESVTYLVEAAGRYAIPPVSLNWFNLRNQQVETARVEGFEIRAQVSATRPATRRWTGLLLWSFGIALLAGLTGAVVWRIWPRLSAWRLERRSSYLASEAHAFAEINEALRARHFDRTLRSIDLWRLRSHRPAAGEEENLVRALTEVGLARYGRNPRRPAPESWSTIGSALSAARQGKRDGSDEDRGLPFLNP